MGSILCFHFLTFTDFDRRGGGGRRFDDFRGGGHDDFRGGGGHDDFRGGGGHDDRTDDRNKKLDR